ncbi:ENT domain - like 3 [Theobroma cacao]|nr:ENT domain - like 3 [Theobroma cacao]
MCLFYSNNYFGLYSVVVVQLLAFSYCNLDLLLRESKLRKKPHGRDEIDMIFQIHCMEKEDYGSVLRAFFAQSDRLSWGKERLITELRQELNVTDVEHGELLWKIISDESFKMIREWRKSAPYVQDSLAGELNASRSAPSPMGHASEKKRKTSHASDSIFHKQEPHGQASLGFLPFPTPAPSDDKGRRIVKSKTKIGYHGPYFEHLKEGADVIQIRETKRLLHELRRLVFCLYIFGAGYGAGRRSLNFKLQKLLIIIWWRFEKIEKMIYGRKGTDQVQVEMAKLILNDHERSLLLALAKLSHVSNDDDSRGEVRENKRQIVTHSRFHLQAGGLDSYPPESYPPKKSCTLKSYDPTHPVKLKVPRP